MRKIVYIIPGFHGSANMIRYRRIIKEFRKKGFKIIPIKITWNRRIMSDYVSEFLSQLQHKKDDQVYIFGFSLGAMIAFIVAGSIKPKALILGSLSPFFKEDLRVVKKSWKRYIGKNRLVYFKNFSFIKLLEKNKQQKMYLLVGAKEDKTLLKKTSDVYKKIKKSKKIIVHGARHNLKDLEYFKNIIKIIEFKATI